MACGLGAVILVLMLVKFNEDVSIPEDDLLKADLARLQAAEEQLRESLKEVRVKNESDERDIRSISDSLKQLDLEANQAAKSNTAKRRELSELEAKLEKIEVAERSDVLEQEKAGEEQYLIGLKVEGRRVGILFDQSASMTDRRLIDIVRRKNGSAQDRVTAPKWQRAIRVVQWLLARLPKSSEVAVVAFNKQARQLGEGGWTLARDAQGLRRILEDVAKLDPSGPTNLQAGLNALNRIGPSDIYVVTDGLPTMGDFSYKSLNPFSDCSALWGGSSTISGECRLKLFKHTLDAASPRSGVKVNSILLPIEGDPEAAHAYWLWSASTSGLLISPARSWP